MREEHFSHFIEPKEVRVFVGRQLSKETNGELMLSHDMSYCGIIGEFRQYTGRFCWPVDKIQSVPTRPILSCHDPYFGRWARGSIRINVYFALSEDGFVVERIYDVS